jgi:type IV secretion system protein VirD4
VAGGSAVALAIATSWIATQRAAAALGHQAALGDSTVLFDQRIYAPWSFLVWEYRFRDQAPHMFARIEESTAPGWALSAVGVAAFLIRRKKPSANYGSARWADIDDLYKARLLGAEKGMVLAQTHDAILRPREGVEGQFDIAKEGTVLRHDGPDHVMAIGAPRSGKGVGTLLPNLYNAPSGPDEVIDSAVIFDMTGENYAKSAGFRSKFSRCLKIAPHSRNTHQINLLTEVRPGDHEISGAQKLAHYITESSTERHGHVHFEQAAAQLIEAGILHVLYTSGPKTLPAVANLFEDVRSPRQILEMMLDTKHLNGEVHPFIARRVSAQLARPEEEAGSVFSTVRRHLAVFADPLAANALSGSDFTLDDLRDGDRPVSLYIVFPKSDSERLMPIIRLFLNLLAAKYTEDRTRTFRRQLNLFYDEFAMAGRLKAMAEGTAFFGGGGLRVMFAIQDIKQLKEVYGLNNPFLANCKVKVVYGVQDDETAAQVSRWLGQQTCEKVDPSGRKVEFGRPLMYPDEVMAMPPDEVLIFKAGMPPYRAKRILAYDMACYKGLDQLAAPDSSPEKMRAQCPPPRPSPWEAHQAQPAPPRPEPIQLPLANSPAAGPARSQRVATGELSGKAVFDSFFATRGGYRGGGGQDD